MDCLLVFLCQLLMLESVLSSPPAPVNVTVDSVNFHHVLRWDPGPGTPSGTQYRIFKRVQGKKKQQQLKSTTTSFKLNFKKKEKQYLTYQLIVQASYNQTLSPESQEYIFTPYEYTTIGPPKLSLAGCGNCIQINISLPEADRSSGIDDIQKFYDAHFRVLWRKDKKAVESCKTQNKTLTLKNLEEGVEYCVQVHTEIRLNKHTKPSAWKCTFTGIVEPHRDPFVLGAVAALVILVVGILMTSMFCLHYTGFLCKLKATLPRAITALSQGYTLTPEGTILDPVCIGPEIEKQKKHNNPTMPNLATGVEDVDEEEEDGINAYMDRDVQHSSGESLCWGSGNVSENREPAALGDCERLSVEVEVPEVPDAEVHSGVTYEGTDEDETKAEGAKVSFMPEEDQTGLLGQVTSEKEEMKEMENVFDSSGNVNLFSVTLAALDVGKQEEEEHNTRDSLSALLKLSYLEPLLPEVQRGILSNIDSQTESDDQITVELMQPTHKDFTQTGYEGMRANISGCIKTCDVKTQHEEAQEEEEEDHDEFFEYMAHT